MAQRRPGPGELLAGASGLLLLLAMSLPWFGLNGRARVPGSGEVISLGRDNLSAWEAFGAIDVVLAVTAGLAIAVLVVGMVREPPSGLALAATAGAALAALLIVYRLIDVPDIPIADPGDTTYETARRLGAFFGLLCTAGIAWGAGTVAAASAPARAAGEPVPAAPAPAASAPAASVPVEHVPAAHVPAGPVPAEHLSAAPAPTEPAPTEPAPTEPAPATPSPTEHIPAASAPAAPAPAAPAPAAPAPPNPASPQPTPAGSPLHAWTRPAIDAECQAAWRRHDRRLGAGYARYFEAHPDLAGEQRTSARDLVAALPPGWEAPAHAMPDRPWQRHHLSAKSSQMLGIALIGVAASRDPSLGWLWDALGPLPPASDEAPRLEFEHVVEPALLGERPRQTSFDVLIDDPGVLIGIETKWREQGVGACRCRGEGVGPEAGGRCSRRVEERDAYWETASAVFGLGERDPGAPCPISPLYETVRHAAALRELAGPGRPAVLALVYDSANPYYAGSGDWPGWPALIGEAVEASAEPERFRFVAVSWQQLVPTLPLDEPTRAWAADKHGLD